jgi:3-oxoacyl-[acyl-carrier-protein] synthase III
MKKVLQDNVDIIMLNNVYITKLAKFFPNQPVSNDDLEIYLGKIKDLPSRTKALILRNNGIKNRFYALDRNGNSTHTNADLAAEAIRGLVDDNFRISDIQLLTCGTASPDQLMPSHASMVHGLIGGSSIDVMSACGSCNSSMWALNYAIMSIQTGKYQNAVCTGSEKLSSWMQARNFEEESKYLATTGENPFIAFEKEFLRWMLSDAAAAALLQNQTWR